MKTVGVIGGLGPMATIYYMELITNMTDAQSDQEHLKIFLESVPDTPDRTAFILGKSNESPLPPLIRAGRELAGLGADFLTIPCVTAHYFYRELCETLPIPVISLCESVAADIAAAKIRKVGILATSGTIQSQVLEREFQKAGIETLHPDPDMQQTVMEIIYGQMKKGVAADRESFMRVSQFLRDNGAQKLILGCTELCLLKRQFQLDPLYVDMLEVLARKTVLFSGAPLKAEYQNLIE